MNKKELIIISILTALLAIMDITGIPSVFFVNIEVLDINPIYFTLMVNFIIIGIIAYLVLKYFSQNWKLGFKRDGLINGFKKI